MRPVSIMRFEQVYLTELALGLLNSLLLWDTISDVYASDPNGAMLGPGFLIGSLALSLAVSLLLWFFTARKASNIARWITTLFLAIGVASTVYSFAMGAAPAGLSAAISVAAVLLQIAALYFLFQPDARGWFADGDDAFDEDEAFDGDDVDGGAVR